LFLFISVFIPKKSLTLDIAFPILVLIELHVSLAQSEIFLSDFEHQSEKEIVLKASNLTLTF